jgi:predicted phage terminase large subunit-like protein
MVATATDILRQTASPAEFAEYASGGWWKRTRHLDYVNEAVLDVAAGSCRQLIIEMPPGTGKSEMIGRWFPSWYLGTFPDHTIAYVSHEADQAAKYGRSARDCLTEFGGMFGVGIRDDSSAAKRWNIAVRRGGMHAVGIGGPIMGKRLNGLILDDPIKDHKNAFSQLERDSLWEWIQSSGLRRLEPGAWFISIMHRWHQDDITARLKKLYPQARVITLPFEAKIGDQLGRKPGAVLWPERWSDDFAEVKRSAEGYWWSCLYQQEPIGQGMAAFPSTYFDCDGFWFDDWPHTSPRVVSLDPSLGRTDRSDYSAFIRLGAGEDGHLYVQADIKRRPTPRILDDAIQHMLDFDPTAISIESDFYQELLVPLLEEKMQRGEIPFPERFGGLSTCGIRKEIRIWRLAPWLKERLIHFHDDPETQLLVQQLKEFPLGTHDDGPDALEQAIRLMQEVGDGFEPQGRVPQVPLEYR